MPVTRAWNWAVPAVAAAAQVVALSSGDQLVVMTLYLSLRWEIMPAFPPASSQHREYLRMGVAHADDEDG